MSVTENSQGRKAGSLDTYDESKEKEVVIDETKEADKDDVQEPVLGVKTKDLTQWANKMSTLNATTPGGTDVPLEERLERVREYYNKGGLNYDDLWGKGNIHFGIFPALDGGATAKDLLEKGTTFLEGANALNDLMIELSGITGESRVLDFGSGYGGPARYVGSQTQATVLGIDLAEANVDKASTVAVEEGLTNVTFTQGSFLDLPPIVKSQTWTHIWNQLGICHCYAVFEDIVKEANRVLPIGGRIVWNDYTGNKPETDLVRKFVCDLMHYSHLVTSDEYLGTLRKHGFEIEHHFCEEWKNHFLFGHDLLIQRANELGIPKSAEWYQCRKQAVENGLYSNQLVIARKVRELVSSE